MPWPPKHHGNIFDPYSKKDSTDKKHIKEMTEYNVMFSKRVWSYIDFKEDLNKKLCGNSSPKQKIYPLFEIINLWVTVGKINCFKNSNFGSIKNTPLTMNEFKRLCIKTDSAEERFVDDKGDEKIVKGLKTDTLGSDKILGFLVKEDWYFNKLSGLMEKKLIGFAPVYFDAKTQKQKELYWVYYPQCCEMLSSYQTFNPNGGKEIFTYRDFFLKHSFSSYVIKESNVYDRDKPENAKGFEVDVENNKNKEKLDNSEDDLWSK